MKLGITLVCVFLLIVAAATSALAGQKWICSITDAVAIESDGTVGPPDLGGLATPTFMRVDQGSKEITLLAPESRKGEITRIDSVHQGDGTWVFSGVENSRAWSLVISESGHMTLSIAVDGAVWSVFGSAMLQD